MRVWNSFLIIACFVSTILISTLITGGLENNAFAKKNLHKTGWFQYFFAPAKPLKNAMNQGLKHGLQIGATNKPPASTLLQQKFTSNFIEEKNFPKPDWTFTSSIQTPNRSYLEKRDLYLDPVNNTPLIDQLMVPKLANKMRLEYQDQTREYFQKETYGQIDPRVEKPDYYKRMKKFASYVLRHVFNYQVTEGIKKAEKNSEELRTFRKVNDKVQAVAKGVSLQVEDSFKIGTKTDIPAQKGKLWFSSNIVNGSVDVIFGEPFDLTLNGIQNKDPYNQKEERYKFSLSRHLPLLNANTGVSYGLNTTIMTASVSKQLLPHLNCEVSTVHGLDENKSGRKESEQTIRFSYGVRF